jgi:hypothetical protein
LIKNNDYYNKFHIVNGDSIWEEELDDNFIYTKENKDSNDNSFITDNKRKRDESSEDLDFEHNKKIPKIENTDVESNQFELGTEDCDINMMNEWQKKESSSEKEHNTEDSTDNDTADLFAMSIDGDTDQEFGQNRKAKTGKDWTGEWLNEPNNDPKVQDSPNIRPTVPNDHDSPIPGPSSFSKTNSFNFEQVNDFSPDVSSEGFLHDNIFNLDFFLYFLNEISIKFEIILTWYIQISFVLSLWIETLILLYLSIGIMYVLWLILKKTL